MTTVRSVFLDGGEGLADLMLDIHLANGNVILFTMASLAEDPASQAPRLRHRLAGGHVSAAENRVLTVVGRVQRMQGKIKSVGVVDGDPMVISVELSSGNSVLLDLKAKLGQPEFAEIPTLSLPRTDGREVYWYNGAHLDLEEIKTLLAESGTANEKEE